MGGLLSCAAQPPRFKTSQDEVQHREVRGFPAGSAQVWSTVLEVLGEYKIFKKDPAQGLILTNWRERLKKSNGSIGGTMLHGVKIEESGSFKERREAREFVIKNRLHIVVEGNSDSATVSVTNYYTARPKDYFGRDGDNVDYGNKAYSVSDFDTREQFVILNRIAGALEKKSR